MHMASGVMGDQVAAKIDLAARDVLSAVRDTKDNSALWSRIVDRVYGPFLHSFHSDILPKFEEGMKKVDEIDMAPATKANVACLRSAGNAIRNGFAAEHPMAVMQRVDAELLRTTMQPILHASPSFVTFMHDDALEAFKESGQTMDFWALREQGKQSWHRQFSDAPEVARCYSDIRTFGFPSKGITFGAVVKLDDTFRMKRLAQMYGPNVVIWNNAIGNNCTFCINDSQEGAMLMPYLIHNGEFTCNALYFLDALASSKDEPIASRASAAMRSITHSCGVRHGNFHFIEFQHYAPLTIGDCYDIRRA